MVLGLWWVVLKITRWGVHLVLLAENMVGCVSGTVDGGHLAPC